MRSPSIRSRPEIRLGRAAALVAALLVAAGARAADAPAAAASADAVKQSREHYRKGQEAYDAQRYEDAYREFEQGYALVAKPAFLLNMAHSERRRGNLSNARALYQKFLLVDPQSHYAGEVRQVIGELDRALAAEAPSRLPVADPAPPLPPLSPPAALVAPPTVVAPPPRPLRRRWWLWASAGAAVVVAAVATAVLLGRSSYQSEGSLGTLGR